MSTSAIRQNYHPECEAAINKQINIELHASYVYQSMAWYFDRDDIGLKGFHKFFSQSSKEELQHAEKMIKYQNDRGGTLVLQPIDKPEKDSWGSGLDAMQSALALEKTVNQCLLDLHKLASDHQDPHLTNWLESEFLEEQVTSIKGLSTHITNLKRVGTGHGEYAFDQKLFGSE